MERKDFPNAAFGYVSDDGAYRMLLHHDPERVKTGKEHGTVDPMLLFAALCLIESIPISERERDRVRADLQSHADVLFAFENDGPAPDFKLWEDEDTDGLPIAMHDKLRDFAFFKANMDGASEVPPVQTEGRGSAYIAYNKRTKEMSWWIQHLDLVATENAAHFHIGRSGKPGPVEIPLELGNMKNGSQILSVDQEKALFEGNMFVNIHSTAYPAGEIRGQVFPTATSRGNQSEHPLPKSGDKKGKKDKNGKKDTMKAEQVSPPSEPNPQPQFQENIQVEPDRRSGDGGPDVSKPPAETRLNPDRGGGPDVSKPPKDEKPQPTVQENISVEKDRKSGDGGPSIVKPPSEETPQATMVETEPTTSQKPTSGGPEVTTPPGEVTPQEQVRQFNPPIYSKDLYTTESGFVDFGRPLLNVMVDGDSPIFGDETTRNVIENQNSTGAPNQPKVVSSILDDNNKELQELIKTHGKGDKSVLREKAIELMRKQSFCGRLIVYMTQEGDKTVGSVIKVKTSGNKSDLPDVAFAVIERGGKRDAQGRTKPQGLRHLPHHMGDVEDGNDHDTVDMSRLRNALARMNQIKAGTKDTDARIQRIAKAHLIRHAKAKLPTSKFAKSDQCRLSDVIAELDEAILQLAGSGAIYVEAKLMEVNEESTVKLFRLKMGEESSPDTFFVRVRFDENGNARWIEFDFDTILPARTIPDFTKFLKSLPQEK